MIYTFGDSFTKWHWPTWSDWLGKYLNTTVNNWAFPGNTNEHIYYTLVNNQHLITERDTIYIMWTGNNRVSFWYDRDFLSSQDITDFFPDSRGQLWFTNKEKYQGLYKCHPKFLPSLTNMIISNFDIVLKTQWLLNSLGCAYYMMFWQNPWADTREVYQPEFQITWFSRTMGLSVHEKQFSSQLLDMPVVKNLLKLIDWSRFIEKPKKISDPNTYTGLWEFLLNSPELFLFNHETDHHPNTLAQHDWVTQKILPGTIQKNRNIAMEWAKKYQNLEIPSIDYRLHGISTGQSNLIINKNEFDKI
jgi:hypothetical protein